MQTDLKRHADNANGFTLIETLIALAILSFGILAIASLQVTSINGAATARFSTEASVYAQEQLEKMLGMDYDPQNGIIPAELTVGSHTLAQHVGDGQDDDDLPASKYTLDWDVIGPDVPVDDSITIEMTVSWQEHGIDRSISYSYVKGSSI